MKSIAEDLNFSSPGRTVDLSRKMIKLINELALDMCIEYRTLFNVVLTHCLRIRGAKPPWNEFLHFEYDLELI